jgi:hypothetical protein
MLHGISVVDNQLQLQLQCLARQSRATRKGARGSWGTIKPGQQLDSRLHGTSCCSTGSVQNMFGANDCCSALMHTVQVPATVVAIRESCVKDNNIR